MSVFVCAHARVYVYVQVYVRDLMRAPARMCECIRARMRSVLMCAALLYVRACTHVCLCAFVGA